MIELAFEVWKSETENSLSCFLPSAHNDRLFETVSPEARVIHVIYGSSTDDVMGKYYAWNGWNAWKPIEGVTDRPWSAEELHEQMALRPAYYETGKP